MGSGHRIRARDLMFERTNFDLSELPFWRKSVLAACVGLWLYFGVRQFDREVNLYAAPSSPRAATKQVYPVNIHGTTVYVTQTDADELAYWRRMTPTIVGTSLLLMVLAVATYRGNRSPR